MSNRKSLITAVCLVNAACSGDVYLRDGVTDGDTFFLSTTAMTVDDPVTRSWVSYSLTRSACQLRLGGENPARAGSFDCELIAREHLLETWREQQHDAATMVDDRYLGELEQVADAGFLPEYVAYYFNDDGWKLPSTLDNEGFRGWRKKHLRGHRPGTRLTGAWGYAHKGQFK